MSSLLAHGLGTDPVEPDWPPLTDAEVTDIVGPAHVVWRSPAPCRRRPSWNGPTTASS